MSRRPNACGQRPEGEQREPPVRCSARLRGASSKQVIKSIPCRVKVFLSDFICSRGVVHGKERQQLNPLPNDFGMLNRL